MRDDIIMRNIVRKDIIRKDIARKLEENYNHDTHTHTP